MQVQSGAFLDFLDDHRIRTKSTYPVSEEALTGENHASGGAGPHRETHLFLVWQHPELVIAQLGRCGQCIHVTWDGKLDS